MKYFTADLHIGHANIIKYCDRPFLKDGKPDIHRMKQQLIDNFRNVIKPGDELYILGDLSFDLDEALSFLNWVPGQKFIVWGNHDPRKTKDRAVLQKECVKTGDILETTLASGKQVVMCHYPMLRWNKAHFGSFMLHGHTHGNCKYPQNMRILDVGVDNEFVLHPKYFPVSEEEINRYMKTVPWIEHHYFDESKRET